MSSEEVGVYFTAFKLSMFASISLMAINSIASPKFAEMYGKNNFSRFPEAHVTKNIQNSQNPVFRFLGF